MRFHKLLFIGDSLIEFYDWQKRLPAYQVYNYGQAGETAGGLLARLPAVLATVPEPDLVMVMIGTNNLAMEDYGFLPVYEKILERIALSFPRATILATSLLPIRLPWLADSAVPRLNRELHRICTARGLVYFDIYSKFLKDCTTIENGARSGCFEADGVHLRSKGYEVWAQALENLLPTVSSA